nr:nitrite reductase (NAD(P)H) small subunit [Aliamphritea spongicola]
MSQQSSPVTQQAVAQDWHSICPASELVGNAGICALIRQQQVAIFYLPDENAVYALDNYDPIGKANVLSRG